jgi:alpha-tubulin suppressor-like RCC1 family protein
MGRSRESFSDKYFDDPVAPKKNQWSLSTRLFSVSAVGIFLLIGSTLASNINLGSGQSVEFGQGVAITVACDDQIVLTPIVSFFNSPSGGSFYFSSFRLSEIDPVACNGVSFSLKAYGNQSATPLTLFSTNTSAIVTNSSTVFSVGENQPGLTLSDTGTAGSFIATFTSPVALASDVYRITIETSGNGTYSVSSVSVSSLNLNSISTGDDVTCGVTTDSRLYCWGSNSLGQLGIGIVSRPYQSPVEVSSIIGIASVSVDRSSGACALKTNGDVYCWGEAGNGRIGDGSGNASAIPVAVSLGGSANAISAGGGTTCALLSTYTVKCWGYNYWGQIGNGTDGVGGAGGGISSVLTPTSVTGLSNVSQISKGSGSTVCALKSTGTIHCWGYGTPGTLGDGVDHSGNFCWTGTTPNCSVNLPVQVSGISNATQVSVGDNHACALLATGAVKCWGSNSGYKLGIQTAPDSCNLNREVCALAPITVSGITSVQQIEAGANNTCALKTDGTVYCWGSYGVGMLGTNASSDSYSPVQIAGLSGATNLKVGSGYACAIIASGQIKCWGTNSNGQFGNGTTTSSSTPS